MDELTRQGFLQQYHQQQQRLELENKIQAMIDALLLQKHAMAQNSRTNQEITTILPNNNNESPATFNQRRSAPYDDYASFLNNDNAIEKIDRYPSTTTAAIDLTHDNGTNCLRDVYYPLLINNDTVRNRNYDDNDDDDDDDDDLAYEKRTISRVCSPNSDIYRPFCLCRYKTVWLPRDVKSYQINERSQRYFNSMSMIYDQRKYYEHRFSAPGHPNLIKLNLFIDDRGNLYGSIERNDAPQYRSFQFKFNLMIRNMDTNEFISHEGLALPMSEKPYHFAFRVERPLFNSYFVERKLIRGKIFSCNIVVERNHVFNAFNPVKRYFK